ncbi:ATP-binding cassette domain-containing protein [Mycolicibacter hiberniae]|uniref:Molybdenum import ATP-binding protein ModC n=1 Tax=Mycolicibacter hiberniae TaxID=29314 RepID=A0A7I7WZS5_9MYCO|nr:ATP-binding cassette domain-containing protein [Mycolicibacter hiberniae]MCV7084467.1 ATP-binding cassette domain-containing protein [Mycolicibacter hiberniae]ORV67558.1 molybdenum ABC transporter ATP-binding protein [Mycolicibacter hiberniae]BBZ23004.1 molybdenum import ATP-binding protein ModC [Mycolicibacter hiberniae]
MSADAVGLTVRAVVPERGLDVRLNLAPGEILAVLGPNGAGKSTLLHVIAGLVQPDDGLVRAGDRILTDTGAGVRVATFARRIGLLLQDPLLFPHLNVAANVAFGAQRPRYRPPWRRAGAHAVAAPWLRAVGAEGLAGRRPHQLSGGQAQRVAIARALAAEPEVLLLDEPLSGLDVGAASAVRRVLRDVLGAAGRTTVLVTHDLLDVFALADRVLVLESGRVAEVGRTADVLAAPRSRFGAQIAGFNLVAGVLDDAGVLHTGWGETWRGKPGDGVEPGRPAVAVSAPQAVAVYRERPGPGSPRNVVQVTLAGLEVRGSTVSVRGVEQPDGAPGLAADITADAAAELRLAPGETVWFGVKAQEVTLRATHPGAA